MKKEAASAGVLDTRFGEFARLQIRAIEDPFAGKKPAMPPEDLAAFKRAAGEEDKRRSGNSISRNAPHCSIGRVQSKGTIPLSCPGGESSQRGGAEGTAAPAPAYMYRRSFFMPL